MVKCPFCSFANEDGALFCEQCKSDISSVAPTPTHPSAPPPTPMPESLPMAEAAHVPMAEAFPEAPVMAAIIEDVEVVEATPIAPMEIAPMETLPLPKEPAAVVEVAKAVPMAEAVPAAVAELPAPPPGPAMVAGLAAAEAVIAAPPAKPTAGAGTPIPPGAQPKLVVQRGLKIGEEYGVFPGENFIGRADEKPVDVDLTFQEPEDRVWTSRQHALLVWDDVAGVLTVEDLNSSNGTFVNRERVYPGQPRQLYVGNTVQIGTVHMRVKA
jgi:hypothetical protein